MFFADAAVPKLNTDDDKRPGEARRGNLHTAKWKVQPSPLDFHCGEGLGLLDLGPTKSRRLLGRWTL